MARNRWLAGMALWVMLAASGCGQQSSSADSGNVRTFTFTAIPDQDEQHLRERFSRIADYLEKTLDVPVKYVPVKSYPAAVTAFVNDQVQLAWFGGLSGVQARARVPGSEAIVQGTEDRHFRSYFIANAATGIDKADDLPAAIKGKRFTFGAKGSTSGRLMPEYYVRQRFGAAPEEVFSRVGFSGDHSRTIQLVQSGAYEVGALNFQVWKRDLERGVVDTDKVHVIWRSPAYPDYQFTIRGDVDATWGDGFKKRVKQALVDLDDQDLLAVFPRSDFVPANNGEYDPIRETGQAIGILN